MLRPTVLLQSDHQVGLERTETAGQTLGCVGLDVLHQAWNVLVLAMAVVTCVVLIYPLVITERKVFLKS